MRLQLNIQPISSDRMLPINYQYEFSAWIYRMIHFGDAEFAKWLHDKGYTQGGKSFKLFTFSNLSVDRFKVAKDRFIILSDSASITFSFFMDEAATHFVSGLFLNSTMSIGDRKSKVDFQVTGVESLKTPDFSENKSGSFKAVSPVCISSPVMIDDKLGSEYLPPEHPEYERRFFENLTTRYNIAHADSTPIEYSDHFKLHILSKPKSRLVKIKADTPQETHIRGWLYNFECKAPAELLAFGYTAGFGEKGSLGFGCVGEITDEIQNTRIIDSK